MDICFFPPPFSIPLLPSFHLSSSPMFPHSTSNLHSTSEGYDRAPARMSEANSRLRSKLFRSDQVVDELQRENLSLGAKVSSCDIM